MEKTQNKGVSVLFHSTLAQRVVLFVIAFVLLSGLSGSWLIATRKLLFPFYFGVYGSAGKSLLFGLVAFLLLTKDRIFKIEVGKWQKKSLLFGVVSIASLGAFFFLASQLLAFKTFTDAPFLTIATHATLWVAGLSATIGIFGVDYILRIAKTFWKELLFTIFISIIFYFLFGWIFMLWPFLSGLVLLAVSDMLSWTTPNIHIVPPLTIQLPQFAITVGEYCSGIESLFLITTLYLLIGCLERKRIRKLFFLLYYLPLIIGMFGLNIVRVYAIIQVGMWLGPEIAGKLFHTYIGMILFMGYFFIFWKCSTHTIIQTQPRVEKE